MKGKYLLLILAALTAICPLKGTAQRFSFPMTEEGSKKTAHEIFLHNSATAGPALPDTVNAWSYMWFTQRSMPVSTWPKILSANTQVKMYVNHAHDYKVNRSYVYRMVYTLYGYKKYSDSVNNIKDVIVDTLTIGYNPDSLTAYQDIALKSYPNYFKSMVIINTIFSIASSGTPTPYSANLNSPSVIDSNFNVEVTIGTQRYTRGNYTPATMGVSPSASPTGDFLQVAWNASAAIEPANYELEWTYIDDYSGGANTTYDFRHNSSRIVTSKTSYKIPLVYQKGWLLYRVRMVRPDSIFLRTPIYGPWSLPDNGAISSASGKYQIGTGHMADAANWQYTISFAEEGKYKHVMSYFDGLLYNRQSITRFNSLPNKLLVTQNIYDYEGHPSIKTLPAPTSSSLFQYQPNVALHAGTGVPYRAEFFDTVQRIACPAEPEIEGLAPSSVASIYYSPLNTDTLGAQKFVPDAGGYPMVQTIYAPGYDKRIERQGGAGDSLQIGRDHDTRYEYVSEDQMDLNRLLGMHAGNASFYHKTVSKDPNGQYAVSVKDYQDKQIMSALIGEVPDTLSGQALVNNSELPTDTMYYNDLMAGSTQKIVGASRVLDNSFFMDATANDVLKYNYRFVPYPVCTSPSLGLSVNAFYNCAVFDKCGKELINKSGVVGVTGVIPNAMPVMDSVLDTAYLDKGKYTIHKELYVNEADVDIAIDSFFHTSPTCLLTEDWFIHREVKSTTFPCPPEGDECEKLKKDMMEELFPKGKYGMYNVSSSGGIAWDVAGQNSIFDKLPNPIHGVMPEMVYRYQYPCAGGSLDTVHIYLYGQVYTRLDTMDGPSFLNIYQNSGNQRYKIAEAMLPIHPEYCKLQGCFPDTFEVRFRAIPDAKVAADYGLLTMSDILSKDPLAGRLNGLLGGISTSYGDSLRLLKNVGGIDTLSLKMAYCGCSDTSVRSQCMTAYATELSQLILPPTDEAKNVYFKHQKDLYLFNRDKYKSYLYNLNGQCGPCQAERMQLIPQPLIPTMYNANGTLDTSSGSVLGMFSGSVRTQLLGLYGGGSVSNDPDTLNKYKDSATIAMYHADTTLCSVQIDSIMGRMANCPAFSSHAATFKSNLQALVVGGTVHFGQFTPTQVRTALVNAGIALGELCNPYLPSYDYSDNLLSSGYGCMDAQFYADAKTWLNSSVVLSAIGGGTVSNLTLNNGFNLFEQKLCSSLGIATSQSVAVTATFNATEHKYTLDLTYGGQTLNLYIKSAGNTTTSSTGNVFTTSGGWSGAFSKVTCIREQSTFSAEGLIGSFVFGGEIQRANSGSVETYACFGWNSEAFAVNTAQANPLGACIPCTEMKKLYKDFRDTMMGYSVAGTDHPLYSRMLRSYMNYNLNHVFGATDYMRFIESCALADSTELKQYMGYGRVIGVSGFNPTAFASTAASNGITLQSLLQYKEPGSGIENLIIDYAAVPYGKLATLDSLVSGVGGVSNTPFNTSANPNTVGWLLLPGASATIPTPLSGLFTYNTTNSMSVMVGSSYQAYTRLEVVKPAGMQPYQLSRNIAAIRQYIVANGLAASWLTTRLSTVDGDYYKSQKQDLLHYTYGLQQYPLPRVLDSLAAPVLTGKLPSLSSQAATYQLPGRASALNNLYYTATANQAPGYTVMQYIMNAASTALGGRLFPAGNPDSVQVPLSNSDTLTIFRCRDNTYWYRYFNGAFKLYNIYLRVPAYVFESTYPSLSWGGTIANAAGDTTSRAFELPVNIGGTLQSYNVVATADFDLTWSGRLRDVLLSTDVHPAPPLTGLGNNCEQGLLANAVYAGKVAYQQYIDQFRQDLRSNFLAYLQDSISEGLSMGYNDRRFNMTLYRYDRAGNLIETIPPTGVNKLTLAQAAGINPVRTTNTYASTVPSSLLPQHHKESRYYFNTIDKPTSQTTPDGGNVDFYYDPAGRVVFSQNDQQQPLGKFSYTLYDEQSRIVETGQVKLDAANGEQVLLSRMGSTSGLYNNIMQRSREDVVATVYDAPALNLSGVAGMSAQENLRKRVACVKAFESLSGNVRADTSIRYRHATHYSYDISGNVKMLVQEFPELGAVSQQFKRIDYEYDLWSGKVQGLSYNRGFADQYFQRYGYDDDNRITTAESSPDGIIWRQEASYQYYQHGPLARVSIGDLRVQNLDYAYTISGWLKAINGDTLAPMLDMGRDGLTAHSTPDAYATGIQYFKGDYRPIGNTPVTALPQTGRDLYNGNIAQQSTAIRPFTELVSDYTYDQLNRIRAAQYATVTAPANGNAPALSPTTAFASKYGYDMDGNIRRLVRRNATGTLMDTLDYFYNAAPVYNNRLQNVTDQAATTVGGIDLPQRLSATPAYLYDATGRVIKDIISKQDTIVWNLYNKLTTTKNSTDRINMFFAYDGAGNRVSKEVDRANATGRTEDREYYVRDASGNIIAIYKNQRLYKDSLISLIAYVIDKAFTTYGLSANNYIGGVLVPDYSSDPAFRSAIIGMAGNIQALRPVSYYLRQVPAYYTTLMNAVQPADYLDTLIDYENAAHTNAFGRAVDNMSLEGQGMGVWAPMSKVIQQAEPKDADRLIDLMSADLRLNVKASLGIDPSLGGDDEKTALRDGLGGEDGMMTAMNNARRAGDPAKVTAWLSDAVHDKAWKTAAQTLGEVPEMAATALAQYAVPDSMYGFLDTWSGAWPALRAAANLDERQVIAYDDDPALYISSVITNQGVEATAPALAAIPTFNILGFAGSMARRINLTDPQVLMPLYQQITVLKSQRHYLAEHHLYGSARLGIKNYFPGQYYSLWDYTGSAPLVDTTTLNVRMPWWSNALQADINVNATEPWGNLLSQTTAAQAILGQKAYEITNHLGNVMAAVSDKRYELDSAGQGVIKYSKPSLSAAYDYYPFGMLMPGRYVVGGSDSCITTTQTKWVPHWNLVNWLEQWTALPYQGPLTIYPITNGGGTTTGHVVTVGPMGGGVSAVLSVTAGLRQNLIVPVTSVQGDVFRLSLTERRVLDGGDVDSMEIAYQIVQGEGEYLLDYTPQTSEVWLNMSRVVPIGGGAGDAVIRMQLPTRWVLSYTSENQLVRVCPGIVDDKYRFGFNGQHKDNEWAGLGNQIEFKFREFDSRIGRFSAIDPIAHKYPWNSPYAFAENRVIDGLDLEGLEYATFHIYIDFKSGYVTSIQVSKDYELKDKNTMGPGIKYVYHDNFDNKEVPILGRFEKNIYGIYQGGDNPKLPIKDGQYTKYTERYDNYDLEPIDETDASAKQHDLDYDRKNIAGLRGILSKKSSEANENYIKRADVTIAKYKTRAKDIITGKAVTKAAKDAAEFGKRWFRVAENLKKPTTPEQRKSYIDHGPKW